MDTTGKWKIGMLAMAIIMGCTTANAQYPNHHHHPYSVAKVPVPPRPKPHAHTPFDRKQRFAMAMAYLETHPYITVKQYAKMTKLGKAQAETELDAMATGRKRPIMIAFKGKKKVYTAKR